MYKYLLLAALYLSLSLSTSGQESSFTYQGFLRDGGNPANGFYDFSFTIWSTPTGVGQITNEYFFGGWPVNNGSFSVVLDFGWEPFPGAARYLQVAVRPGNTQGPFTVLTPRQLITSSPYSMRSGVASLAENAAKLQGYTVDDFILNRSNIQQGGANFNIAGSGTLAGNLGIGTTASSSLGKLAVSSNTTSTGNNTASFAAATIGPNTSHIHYGNTGDWFIRSASSGGKVVLQDFAGGNVGIGTSTLNAKLHIAVNGGNILLGSGGCGSPYTGIGFAGSFTNCTNYSLLGNGTDTLINRPAGGVISFRSNNNEQLRLDASGNLVITSGLMQLGIIGGGGFINLCINASNQISTCSSSLRYKTDVANFPRGLDIIRQLNPVSFRWKSNSVLDLGLVAEEVGGVEPLLVTRNNNGEIEGVKYDRVGVITINAIKEQQAEIDSLKQQVDALKALLCVQNRDADICRK